MLYPSDSELALAIRPALDKLIELTSQESVVRTEVRMHILSALFELFAVISGTLSKLNQDPAGARNSEAASSCAFAGASGRECGATRDFERQRYNNSYCCSGRLQHLFGESYVYPCVWRITKAVFIDAYAEEI